MAPGTSPPFHKAIVESGGTTARATYVPDHPRHEKHFREFLQQCGLNDTADADVFNQLRALPLSTVADAQKFIWNRYSPSLQWPFQPVIDGAGGIIPDLPVFSMRNGNFLHVPLLTGFDTNEGTKFVPQRASKSNALSKLMKGLIPALTDTDTQTMEQMYPDPATTAGKGLYTRKPPAGLGTQFWRLDDAYAHYAYICPVLQVAHYASSSSSTTAVYVYQYAGRSAAHGAADHGDEGPVVVHDMARIGGHAGVGRTAEYMSGFWSRFVASAGGDPNPRNSTPADAPRNVTWPRFVSPFASSADAAGRYALFASGNDERMGAKGRSRYGVPAQLATVDARLRQECTFWWERTLLSEGMGNDTTLLHI